MHNFYWGYPWEGHLYLRALVVGYICETLSLSDIVESRWWVGKHLAGVLFLPTSLVPHATDWHKNAEPVVEVK